MSIMPEFLILAFDLKLQVSPMNIAMLIGLGLCIAIVWRFAKRRIG